jgi:uncharacterized protein (TIGR03437 family)
MRLLLSLALGLWLASPSSVAQATNQVLGSGFTGPWVDAVTAGEVITLFVNTLDVPDAVASQTPLPTSLSGVSVSTRVIGATDATGYPSLLPILRVLSWRSGGDGGLMLPHTAITVQIPAEKVCLMQQGICTYAGPPALVLNVRANGVVGPDYTVSVLLNITPHVLKTCDSVFGGLGFSTVGVCNPVITHADGTLVSYSSPAKAGEPIVVYATGLYNFGITGRPTGGPIPNALGQTIFSYRLETPPDTPTAYLPVDHFLDADYVGFVSGYVGLGQVNLTVPVIPTQAHECQYAYDANASIELKINAESLTQYGGRFRFKNVGPAFFCVVP